MALKLEVATEADMEGLVLAQYAAFHPNDTVRPPFLFWLKYFDQLIVSTITLSI
jgi:hypothetical protein